MPKISLRCTTCGGVSVMRDAWAVWDEDQQTWVLGNVFDAAYCETCEADASLVQIPFVAGAENIAAGS